MSGNARRANAQIVRDGQTERLRAIAKDALKDLDLESEIDRITDDYTDQTWKEPFLVARRIWTAVLKAGIQPQTINSRVFIPIASQFIEENGAMYGVEVPLRFATAWKTVEWPEVEGPVEYAQLLMKTSAWRADVGDDWPDEATRQDAIVIVTVQKYLEEIANKSCHLSCRKAGELVGKSHAYAAALLRELVDQKILVVRTPANLSRRHAAEYHYVPLEDRGS